MTSPSFEAGRSDVPRAHDGERHFVALLRLLTEASTLLASGNDVLANVDRVMGLFVPGTFSSMHVVFEADGAHVGAMPIPCPGAGVYRAAMTAGAEPTGFLTVGLLPEHEHLGRALADELAARIAGIARIARAYEREHYVAETMQRALLPERLPAAAGLAIDAAYDPGASDGIVGGDWYDAFALPDGRIAISMGDVVGHGLRAAIVMGEVRQAFRAASVALESPALVIERANAVVNMRDEPTIVTAVFGTYDAATNAFTYAVAGHPAPVLATSGNAAFVLPGGGIPLGVAETIGTRDWTIPVPPQALLAFVTDGLIEFGRDVLAGIERLRDAVREEAAVPSASPARGIHARIFDGAPAPDDAATLTLRSTAENSSELDLVFTAAPFLVPLVRDALRRWCSAMLLSEADAFSVLLATGEALANAVEHGYDHDEGLVRLRALAEPDNVTVTVEDSGRWKITMPSDERGRGLPIMRAVMNDVTIERDDTRKIVRLRRDVRPGYFRK